ncbi:hypothetical protein ABH901_001060 [Mammaliicoccus lentus]
MSTWINEVENPITMAALHKKAPMYTSYLILIQ